MASVPRALLLPVMGATLAGVLIGCAAEPPAQGGALPAPSAQASPVATPTPAPVSAVPTSLRAVASPTRPPVPARATVPVLAATHPAARRGVWGLGDSVMLGSRPSLVSRGWRVDAEVGRQFSDGVPIVRRYAGSGAMARNVVISLGTNGTISGSDCRAMVRAAGPSRRVFLVNDHAPRSWIAGNNREIGRCASSFPKDRVMVVDWAAQAAAHPGWFAGDGIHPNSSGSRGYTSLLLSAVAGRGL